MAEPLVPARLAFAADGTPYSQAFGDVYHSAEGGPGQARHVFLGGNDLPERWRGRRTFTVLENGFGFGLNFLATWDAWREAPCERLHFVSIEKHPFTRHDLEELHARYPEFLPLAAQLHAAWPMLVRAVHRLEFERGRVVLTLAFADAAKALRDLRLAADAIYLDGFSPQRNPEMWAPAVMKSVARLCAKDATAATWSAASAVRTALTEAGFEVEKAPGFASKRDMLRARIDNRRVRGKPAPGWPERRAIVIGAGIAGTAVTERLCARGWDVALLEQQCAPQASERIAGVFHPVMTPDDSLFARLTRAGFLQAVARWRALENAGHPPVWDESGVLQLARDEQEDAAQRAAVATMVPPPEFAQYVSREEATRHAGVPVSAGGLWFPASGWMKPAALIAAQMAASGARLQAEFGREVARIAFAQGTWTAFDGARKVLAEAPVAVLANADAGPLLSSKSIRIRRVRGQISFLPGDRFLAPHTVVLRGGFVLPAIQGASIAGASYDFDDEDPLPRASSHEGNLERLDRIVPGAAAGIEASTLEGSVGFRAVSPDRLPLIGAIADEASDAPRNPQLATLGRRPGLFGAFAYGSRGLLWSALGGELIASLIEGEPLAVEARLADAVDPGRFLLRSLRRSG